MNESSDTLQSDTGDQSRRFLFEHADIRGETVQLDEAYREILAIHQYPGGVGRLLGEFLAAAVLLSSNLKFEGKLILQVRSEGQLPLLMVECDDTLQVQRQKIGAGFLQAMKGHCLGDLRIGQAFEIQDALPALHVGHRLDIEHHGLHDRLRLSTAPQPQQPDQPRQTA